MRNAGQTGPLWNLRLKTPAGLIEKPILPPSPERSALAQRYRPHFCVAPVSRKYPPRCTAKARLEGLQRTINSVDYYHCVYELLYRLIESSIAFVPTLSPSQGAPDHETPILLSLTLSMLASTALPCPPPIKPLHK
jgi:hypothetical protein